VRGRDLGTAVVTATSVETVPVTVAIPVAVTPEPPGRVVVIPQN
jgi:hypothetical protein